VQSPARWLKKKRERQTSEMESIMNALDIAGGRGTTYELRFQSLFDVDRALVFPCDVIGRVDLDTLSERARHNYFFAHSVIGRDFAYPRAHASHDEKSSVDG
jgi:hypothetical protein